MSELRSYVWRERLAAMVFAAVAILLATSPAFADRTEPPPKELEGVGVTEHLGAQIPLDIEFVDSDGKPVALKQFFKSRKPVVLTMNYSNCPMLCSLQLNGLFDAMKQMPWTIGDQFEMITVSFDPLETTQRAQATKQKYLQIYRKAGAADGWHFLTGREENIKKLADTIGFHYRYSESQQQYIHVAATYILTPDGRVSRYLYGVQYDPRTLRLSLVEASDGKVGSTTDKILLFCFHYDSESGRYGLIATRLMQFAGGLTVVVVASTIWLLKRREKKSKVAKSPEKA